MSSTTALDNARLRKDLQETELLLQIAEEETAAAQRSLAAVTAENSELKAKVAALEAALARREPSSAKEEEKDVDEEDSDWDCCSCVTPEMCRGGCCTSEDFKEWSTEEKEKGEIHNHPVRDFKKALKGSWGLERRINQCEIELKEAMDAYQSILKSGPDFNGWEQRRSSAEGEVRQMEEWMDHLLKLRDKKTE